MRQDEGRKWWWQQDAPTAGRQEEGTGKKGRWHGPGSLLLLEEGREWWRRRRDAPSFGHLAPDEDGKGGSDMARAQVTGWWGRGGEYPEDGQLWLC